MTNKAKPDGPMAHTLISIRLPVDLVQQLRELALTPEHEGRYQVLIRDILTEYVEKRKSTKKRA